MAKRKKTKKTTDELHSENEFLKMKMMAEFGGNFVGNADNIPPDIENMFLKQVINFHKQHAHAESTTIYKFIGEPDYNSVNDLGEKELRKELKRFVNLLKKNGIILNVLAPTDDRELYRFVTEELFKHEIEGVKMKGWTTQFTYEDFHPNVEYDVRSAVHDALFSIFDKETPFFEQNFSEEMKDRLGLSSDIEEFRDKTENLKASYLQLSPVKYHISQMQIEKEHGKAEATAEVLLRVKQEGDKRAKRIKATIEFYLEQSKNTPSWWLVNRVVTDLM